MIFILKSDNRSTKLTVEKWCPLLLRWCWLLIERLNCLIYGCFRMAEECIFVWMVLLRRILLNSHPQTPVFWNDDRLFPPKMININSSVMAKVKSKSCMSTGHFKLYIFYFAKGLTCYLPFVWILDICRFLKPQSWHLHSFCMEKKISLNIWHNGFELPFWNKKGIF